MAPRLLQSSDVLIRSIFHIFGGNTGSTKGRRARRRHHHRSRRRQAAAAAAHTLAVQPPPPPQENHKGTSLRYQRESVGKKKKKFGISTVLKSSNYSANPLMMLPPPHTRILLPGKPMQQQRRRRRRRQRSISVRNSIPMAIGAAAAGIDFCGGRERDAGIAFYSSSQASSSSSNGLLIVGRRFHEAECIAPKPQPPSGLRRQRLSLTLIIALSVTPQRARLFLLFPPGQRSGFASFCGCCCCYRLCCSLGPVTTT